MYRVPWVSLAALSWYLGLAALLRPSLAPPKALPLLPPASYEAAAQGLLATSDAFYSGAIGYAGTPSVQALAWNTILQSPDASSRFQELFRTGNRVGQLYAMTGLYYTDSTAYRQATRVLGRVVDSVDAVEGCVRTRRPVALLLTEIHSGRWSGMLRTIRPFPAYVPQ